MHYKKLLKNIGLTPVQSEIIDHLFGVPEDKASIIAKKIHRPRGVVYNSLDELIDMGFIIKKDDKNKVSTFELEHPTKLRVLLERRESELNQQKNSFDELLPMMISNYNLAHDKPGIEFFEGLDGLKKVMNDSLEATEVIYSYTDFETIAKHIPDINQHYRKQRYRKGIEKKGIALNTPFAHKFLRDYPKEDRQNIRLIPKIDIPFSSVMQIYDNKLTYTSFNDNETITSMIITDKNLYNMHRYLFEIMWENAKYL
jgi:sugar-specific transcriptional regulator TrmB